MIVVPLLVMAYGPGHLAGVSDSMFAGPLDFVVQFVFPAVAVILFWLARGATPGKMVIGARVVDAATLGKLGTGQAILRYLGYYVSTLPLVLAFLLPLFGTSTLSVPLLTPAGIFRYRTEPRIWISQTNDPSARLKSDSALLRRTMRIFQLRRLQVV